MTTIRNKFYTAPTTYLASAVANAGTFTIAYPTGSTQLSFNAGLATSGSYVMLNGNDRWAVGSPGIAISYDASVITITNNSGYTWVAGTKVDAQFEVADGTRREIISLPLPPMATWTAADIVTEFRPGIEGTIEYWEFVNTIAVTTAAKAATLNLEIDTTNLTGGVIALTSANCTPKGIVVGCSAITGAFTLTRDSKLSVEASAVTAFVEGEGFLNIYVRPNQQDMY